MNFAILILMVFYASASKNPDGGFTFDRNMSDEDNVEIAIKGDYSEPDVVLLPSSNNESENEVIRVVGQSTKDRGQSLDSSEDDNDEIRVVGQSTKDRGPPPSPDVIEIVALDENSSHRYSSRKRPAPLNPTPSKKAKVCFKKDKNSRPILLQDPAIVEVGPASRDPSIASPSYDDGENEDPFFREREHPIDDSTWALWNQNPNRDCPWWQQHR